LRVAASYSVSAGLQSGRHTPFEIGIMRKLMDPDKSVDDKTPLLSLARRQRSLWTAWTHVRERAKYSKDPETREALAKFERDPARMVAQICRSIGNGSFIFEKQRGVAIARSEGKRARPVVVAPIVNRVVQRSILNVCQSEVASIRKKLGSLPEVIAQATSVGGLPNKGVPEAVSQISYAIQNGAQWFIRSDLKNFFQHIPKSEIRTFLDENISERAFCDFFMSALATELENEVALKEDLELFPIGDMGVPQGSALSALCSNIVLNDFDKNLNGRGITTIRYLDDFVILGPNSPKVKAAWRKAVLILESLGLTPHDPKDGSGKAAEGRVQDGFEFLSVHFKGSKTEPSKNARDKVIGEIKSRLSESKRQIAGSQDKPRRADPRFFQTMVSVDRTIRGWADAFRFTNERSTFSELDMIIDKELANYRSWFSRLTANAAPLHMRRLMGIALMADTPIMKPIE
jgi:RNA-directed DNA polymerase